MSQFSFNETSNGYHSDPHWELVQARLAWKSAAVIAMEFIKKHVRIVGWEEINAYDEVKKAIEKAHKTDERRLKNRSGYWQ